MEEKNTIFTSILLDEYVSPNIADLVEIYKKDRTKARIIYNERRDKVGFYNKFLYCFDYEKDKDFRIVSFQENIHFTKKNIMYKRKATKFIIIYKHKNKAFYLKSGSSFKIMTIGQLLNFTIQESKIHDFLFKRFGWLRNVSQVEEAIHLTAATIIKHKLFNREKIIKHAYGSNKIVANVLSETRKSFGEMGFIWKQYKHVLINTDSLTKDFIIENAHLLKDTLRYADMFGETVNAKWNKKRLKVEHDRMYKKYVDIILEFEPLRELNIRPIYLEFQKYTGFNMLTTNHQLIEEGKKQNHCVGTYVGQVNEGSCAIYTIGEYTMEIRFDKRGHYDNELNRYVKQDRKLHLNQIRGYNNKQAPKDLEEIVKSAIDTFNETMDLKHFEAVHFNSPSLNVDYDNDLPF